LGTIASLNEQNDSQPQTNNNNKTAKKQQTNKSTSQYVLNTTMRKQAQIT
jgi:hypothetical protein